jgi:hypothetical protein
MGGLREEVKRFKPPNASKGKGKGEDAKGGRNTKRQKFMPMPKELIGQSSVVDGEKICFDYNLAKGCDQKGVDRCPKGVHKCAFPNCKGDHSFADCDRRGKKRH